MSDQHQVNLPDNSIERVLRRARELLAARGATPHEVEETVKGLQEEQENARAAVVAAMAVASTPYVPPSADEAAGIDARDERLNAIAAEYNLVSIWSCGGDVEMDAPHPYPSATTMVHTTISGVEPASGMRCWGGDGGRFEAQITGPRWLDLWLAADMVIRASSDLHHCFIEGFETDRDDRALLHLGVGS